MDTQIHQNFSLIEEITVEAMDTNVFEAFLESAPQLFVQLYAFILYRGITEHGKKN